MASHFVGQRIWLRSWLKESFIFSKSTDVRFRDCVPCASRFTCPIDSQMMSARGMVVSNDVNQRSNSRMQLANCHLQHTTRRLPDIAQSANDVAEKISALRRRYLPDKTMNAGGKVVLYSKETATNLSEHLVLYDLVLRHEERGEELNKKQDHAGSHHTRHDSQRDCVNGLHGPPHWYNPSCAITASMFLPTAPSLRLENNAALYSFSSRRAQQSAVRHPLSSGVAACGRAAMDKENPWFSSLGMPYD